MYIVSGQLTVMLAPVYTTLMRRPGCGLYRRKLIIRRSCQRHIGSEPPAQGRLAGADGSVAQAQKSGAVPRYLPVQLLPENIYAEEEPPRYVLIPIPIYEC